MKHTAEYNPLYCALAHPSLNFARNLNEQIMIPEGHTIEDIKKREQIIRVFYGK